MRVDPSPGPRPPEGAGGSEGKAAGRPDAAGRRLAAALLAVSPRVFAAGPTLCRVDARGWGRRGGEEALARALAEAATGAGFTGVGVGIADAAVAADVAAAIAATGPVIVPVGEARRFLAPLPLRHLPASPELRETFRALGLRRIGEVADRDRAEFEVRFGPEGLRAHRRACGEDERLFLPLAPEETPAASLDLEAPVETLEPLLFMLRHLLARVCEALRTEGRCAARLGMELRTAAGSRRLAIGPARPTAREDLLFDLCRAGLERDLHEERLPAPVSCLRLRAVRLAPAGARQGDLFLRRWRDPLAADAVLSRLRARLGGGAVVRPAPRRDHRPETRSAWEPVTAGEAGPEAAGGPADRRGAGDAIPPVLRLLSPPLPVRVRRDGNRPSVVWDGWGRHRVEAAEGPERLSGDWWKVPYRREYFRVCTAGGELLWIFREAGRTGARGARWWLHGWWD